MMLADDLTEWLMDHVGSWIVFIGTIWLYVFALFAMYFVTYLILSILMGWMK